jgi:hypothetical protein
MLMKEVESALFRTEMEINGRDPAGISKFIALQANRRVEGLSFFEERRGDICDWLWGDRTPTWSVTGFLLLVLIFC